MTTFKTGDKVITFYDHKPRAVRSVARVTKRFVELSDKTRWQLDGSNSYPKYWDVWHTMHITPWSKEAADKIHRKILIYALRSNREWDNLETDQLEAIVKIAGLQKR